MITIELNDMSAEDVKCIEELRSLGFSDDYIQRLYDLSLQIRFEKEKDNERKAN